MKLSERMPKRKRQRKPRSFVRNLILASDSLEELSRVLTKAETRMHIESVCTTPSTTRMTNATAYFL